MNDPRPTSNGALLATFIWPWHQLSIDPILLGSIVQAAATGDTIDSRGSEEPI